MTTTTMTKGADNHNKKDPPERGKYARRSKARKRDWHLPRRYVVQPSRLTMAMWHSCSWRRQRLQPKPHCRQPLHRGIIIIGSGDDDNHPGIVVAATTPWMTTMTRSWLGSWWLVGTQLREQCCGTCCQWRQLLVWAFTTLTCKLKQRELFWLY
jgi:hypothetical protein